MSDKIQMGDSIKAGSTDVSIPVILRSTADNTEVTAKVYTDVTASYWRQGGTRTAITAATLAAVNSAHSDGGFKEVDATNQPGAYRFDLPDAAVATGADWVIVTIKVTGCYAFHVLFGLASKTVPDLNDLGGTAQTGDSYAVVTNGTYGLSALKTLIDTITNRIGSFTGTGVNTVLGFFQAVLRTDATLPSDVGGTFSPLTDALQALRDWIGDGTNLTEAGGTGDHLTALPDSGGVTTLLARLTAARAGYLDELDAANIPADIDTLLGRFTAARAGYLDNLNVGGLVASSAEVTSVQNNTRVVRVVPTVIERPDSGTTTYRIEVFIYDDVGNMEPPDSAPTVALVNQAGTDLSARLDSATGTLVSVGRYRWIYTATSTDDLEQLVWAFSIVEGGNTREYGNATIIVDTTAVDFTAADRSMLTAVKAVTDLLPDGGALTTLLVNLAAVLADTNELQGDLTDGGRLDLLIDAIKAKVDLVPGDPATETTLAALSALTTAVKTKTDLLPASPAGTGDAMALTTAERDAVALAYLTLTDGIETGITPRMAQRIILAFAAGITSDNGQEFYDPSGTKKRIDGTVSGSERTAVILDGTDV